MNQFKHTAKHGLRSQSYSYTWTIPHVHVLRLLRYTSRVGMHLFMVVHLREVVVAMAPSITSPFLLFLSTKLQFRLTFSRPTLVTPTTPSYFQLSDITFKNWSGTAHSTSDWVALFMPYNLLSELFTNIKLTILQLLC
jgi:hypothetical protein